MTSVSSFEQFRAPLKVLIIVLSIVSVLSLFFWYSVLRAVARNVESLPAARDLPSAEATYRKMGLPWEAKDLDRGEVSDSDAAPIIEICTEKFEKANAEQIIKKADALDKAGRFGAVQQLVKPLEQAEWLGERAVKVGSVHFDHDWDLGPNLEFPHVQTFKRLAKLFAWRAKAEAIHGEPGPSLEDLRRIRGVSRMAGQDEVLISTLVQILCAGLACRAEQYCADLWAHDPQSLQRLSEVESEVQDAPDLRRGLRGEAYTNIALCRNIFEMGGMDNIQLQEQGKLGIEIIDPALLRRTGEPDLPLDKGCLDHSLRFWIDIFRVLSPNRSESLTMGRELAKVEATHSEAHSICDDPLGKELDHPQIFPLAVQAVLKLNAERMVTKALVQALVIRAKTGTFPKDISMVPGNWTDPITQKPLHLKLTDGGIKIYAVGSTGVDHGGLSRSEVSEKAANAREYDIVAEYPWREGK